MQFYSLSKPCSILTTKKPLIFLVIFFSFNFSSFAQPCPTGLETFTAPPIAVLNSTCTGSQTTPVGGVLSAPSTSCPTGSQLQYSMNGVVWQPNPPLYNQIEEMIIITRCNCDVNNSISSMTTTISTQPSICHLSGNIKTWESSNSSAQNVANVRISKVETHYNLNNGQPLSTPNAVTTDASGNFSLPIANQNGGIEISLRAEKNTDWLNGSNVSSSDLFYMQQHIINNMTFESVYQYLAADVSGDGVISTLDLVLIQDVIVNPPNSPAPSFVISQYPSWKFVPSNINLDAQPLPALPYAPLVNESIYFPNFTGTEPDVSWIAVKTGNIMGDVNANLLTTTDTRTEEENQLVFQIKNQTQSKGELLLIPVYADSYQNFIAWQFSMEFNKQLLSFEGMESGAITDFSESKLGLNAKEEGVIGAVWYGESKALQKDEALFTLQFKALQDIETLNGLIDFTSKTVKAESHTKGGTVGTVRLEVIEREENKALFSSFQLFQNQPNPFKNSTSINFFLPKSEMVTLSIFDISGKIIKVIQGNYGKGFHEIEIHANEIPSSGMYFYQLETSTKVATRKMIFKK